MRRCEGLEEEEELGGMPLLIVPWVGALHRYNYMPVLRAVH